MLFRSVLAAHRAGIRRIIIPARNEADVESIPEDVRRELEIIFVSRINEVIDAALEMLVANPPPPPVAASTKKDQTTRDSEPETVIARPAS